MNFSKQLVKILSLFLCMTLGSTVFGNGEEKEKTPKNTREVKSVGLPKPTVATRTSIVSAAEGSVAPAQVQSELDAAVEKLQEKLSANAIVPDDLSNVPISLTAEASEDRINADKMFRYLEKNPDKIFDMLRIEHLVQLPVGIRFPVTKESEALLGILKVEFKPDHAELTVFLRYKFHVKDSDVPERDLFLGTEGIRFTKEGKG